jgi:uncharacterized RDD family membrane protein YckC
MTFETTAESENMQPTDRADGTLLYAGFWRRFGALWLDFVVLLPVVGLSLWLSENYRLAHLYSFVPELIIYILFHVYLVRRYGGTPGKLMLKIRITRLDGSPVGYREAALRYSVLFILTSLESIALLIAILNMSDSEYLSLGFLARSVRLVATAPSWYQPIHILLNVWIWSEFVIMLTNKRRRAPHDFIAGTVVIHCPTRQLSRL